MSADEVVLAALALTRSVDGPDWSSEDVLRESQRLARAARSCPLADAMTILVERIQRSSVNDGDGVAHVAIAGGVLVENGAAAGPLAHALTTKLPDVLVAARRFASACIAELPPQTDDEMETVDAALTTVDERPIPMPLFRKLLPSDRAGGVALAYLEQWTLPAIASLTRARKELVAAQANEALRQAATAMQSSDAHWLPILLDAELLQRWTVIHPETRRAFEVEVDGVVTNFDFHTLLAAALTPLGIPGTAPSAQVLSYLEGRGPRPDDAAVTGSWNIYDHRALQQDLSIPNKVPMTCWVWGEGRPADVVRSSGRRVLVLGKPAYDRSWNTGRTFSAFPQSIRVIGEVPFPTP